MIGLLYTVLWCSPVVPNLGVGPLPKGDKKDLRGHEGINEKGKKKKQTSTTKMYICNLNSFLI